MRYTKENLPGSSHWWYYAYIVFACLLFLLGMPVRVSASATGEKSHVALVIDDQEMSSVSSEARTDQQAEKEVGQASGIQEVQTERITTSRMLQHVFVVVFGGVLCVSLGIGVLIYHIRRDKVDDAYVANIRRCYGELSIYEEPRERNEKENYGGRTVFIREKQA